MNVRSIMFVLGGGGTREGSCNFLVSGALLPFLSKIGFHYNGSSE